MWRDYVLVFFVGMAWDFILTIDIIFTAQYKILGLMSTTFLITIISYLIWPKLYSPETGIKKPMVFTMATGSALGAGVAALTF